MRVAQLPAAGVVNKPGVTMHELRERLLRGVLAIPNQQFPIIHRMRPIDGEVYAKPPNLTGKTKNAERDQTFSNASQRDALTAACGFAEGGRTGGEAASGGAAAGVAGAIPRSRSCAARIRFRKTISSVSGSMNVGGMRR